MTLHEDDELMLRVQEGDPRAFNQLVERHQSSLMAFFIRQTRDPQLAEDLTQETLLRLYNQAWDYLPRGIFRGWMFRIARNLLIDSVRKRSHDALVHAVRSASEDVDLTQLLPDDFESAETHADRAEIAHIVERALQELPKEQRLAFQMFVYSGLSLPEVADAMETSLPTTKSRLRLAREKLRVRMAEIGIHGPDDSDSS